MSLPSSTTVLIVGAGPTGLSAALSLLNQGVDDIVVVDSVLSGENTSRAIAIHAATLEALDEIDCATDLIKSGFPQKQMTVNSRESHFATLNFDSLKPYTRFPFVLTLSQAQTEKKLENRFESLGRKVFRPYRAVGLKASEKQDGVDVLFESGETINAKYVIGADGARSAIRSTVGIGFSDPDGQPPEKSANEMLAQMVMADVTFSGPDLSLAKNGVQFFGSSAGMLLYIPTADKSTDGQQIVRIAFNIPRSLGPPPSKPSLSYLQDQVNKNGPRQLSSDSSVNPNQTRVSEVVWATRFRTHSAIADRFCIPIPSNNGYKGGIVMLVGDSAHIHSPAGGQGMNLGIRDAIALGPAIAAHINSPSFEDVTILEDYASKRRAQALKVIRLTKKIMMYGDIVTSKSFLSIPFWVLKTLVMIPFISNRMVWNVSGLGNR